MSSPATSETSATGETVEAGGAGDRAERRYGIALAVTAASYALWHHLGLVPHGFGDAPHGTRIADWIDLLTPYAVLGPALATLLAAHRIRPLSVRTWVAFGFGAVVYADGHGLHLGTNSVGNSPGYHDPPRTAHLWDEYVGHYLWFGAVGWLVAVLATTMVARRLPAHPLARVGAVLLAAVVGFTWCTNCIGGNMSGFGLPVAVVAAGWGVLHRRDLGVLLLPAGFVGAVGLLVHLTLGVA